MKYKVGDRVRIKSIDWYNENKNKNGEVVISSLGPVFTSRHSKYAGRIMTIGIISKLGFYVLKEDKDANTWYDEMIEGLVEEEIKHKFKVGDILFYRGETSGYLKVEEIRVENGEIRYYENSRNVYLVENDPEVFADKVCSVETEEAKNNMEEKETLLGWVKESDNLRLVPHKDYEIKHDGDNFYLVKKKKEYPKTYKECLSVLEIYNGFPDVAIYNTKPSECDLFESLIRLKRCRDAYWKLYGEEIGLGKSWKPDWRHTTTKYVLTFSADNIIRTTTLHYNYILTFPTEEMRDAFYDNFKEEIEKCKELL